jgi:hypothetical protein
MGGVVQVDIYKADTKTVFYVDRKVQGHSFRSTLKTVFKVD